MELRPCPFCGASARMFLGGDQRYYIDCDGCGLGRNTTWSEEETAQKWNARHTPEPVKAALDALRAHAKELKHYVECYVVSMLASQEIPHTSRVEKVLAEGQAALTAMEMDDASI